MLRRFDEWEALFVRRLASQETHPALWWLMWLGTRAADGWGLFIIIPLALAVGRGRGLAAVCCGAVTGCLAGALVQGVKHLVKRERPTGVVMARPIRAPDRHAFPSGHSAQAFGVLGVALWLNPLLGVALVPAALVVATSRVFFGLHHPSDVVVGSAVGLSLGLGVTHLADLTGLAERVAASWPWP